MKNGHEEPLSPSPAAESRKKSTFWPYRLKRGIKSYVSTEMGLSSVIASLCILVITFILASRYMSASNLIQFDVSTRDIYAEKTLQVEDEEETQRLRYEARQLVAPIYQREAGTDRVIMDKLVVFLENIKAIREDSGKSEAQKIEAIQKLFDQKQMIYPEVLRTLAVSSNWQRLNDTAIDTAEALIVRGVSSEEYRLKKSALIRQSIPDEIALNHAEEQAVVFLVGAKLRPTLKIDERSTEDARNIAASHIKPVVEVFGKGDRIVKKGEKISDLQRAALKKQGSISSKNHWLAVIGVAILSVSLLTIVWGYVYRFEHSNFFKPAYASLLAMVMAASVAGLAPLVDLQSNFAVELYPIAIMPLMVCIFTHPRVAILTTMMILLLCGLTLKLPLDSLSVLVISSLVGVFILARKPVPKDRNDLIIAGLGVGAAKGVVILALSFIYEPVVILEQLSLFHRIWMGVLSGLFSGILTLGALPIVESWFKLVTSYTLLELGNHDRPILRRMQMEAPGTFHHSLMVATLSEAAAEAIGANSILTRVGALYHDIGKIKRPLFFVENQAYFGVENPHDKLTPRLSKMVITAHPRDGVEMAKHLGLPKIIQRFMPEHHGTLVAGYFYNKAVLEEGEENVNKAQFRYPGPKPQSKETAIVMMADACESAVRALKNPTITQVEERVDKIIKQRVDDGQFSECPITFQDIHMVRETFVRILRGIQHNRIEYQQNVLQELGKKTSALEGSKQATQSLKAVQDSLPVMPHKSASSAKTEPGMPAAVTMDPLIELDSLAELPRPESHGPECC